MLLCSSVLGLATVLVALRRLQRCPRLTSTDPTRRPLPEVDAQPEAEQSVFPLSELRPELLRLVLLQLPSVDAVRCARVSREWAAAARSLPALHLSFGTVLVHETGVQSWVILWQRARSFSAAWSRPTPHRSAT